jgi:CHASE3 domain sensor protein
MSLSKHGIMAYSNSIMTRMRSMNSKGLQELVASCLIIIILVGIVYAILSNLLHDMPTDEEDSIDQLTRANTAKNRRSKQVREDCVDNSN